MRSRERGRERENLTRKKEREREVGSSEAGTHSPERGHDLTLSDAHVHMKRARAHPIRVLNSQTQRS